MTRQAKAKNKASKPSEPKKKAANKATATPQWGTLMGDGMEVLNAMHQALSRSLDAVGAETLSYSNRAVEQSVIAAGALTEARSIGDVVDVQTRCIAEAWQEASDCWIKLGESATQTVQNTQKSFSVF